MGAGNLVKDWNVFAQTKNFKEGKGHAELYRKPIENYLQ